MATNDSGKQAPADGMRECCQTIKASLTSRAQVHFDATHFKIQPFAIFQVIAVLETTSVSNSYRDHGPPPTLSSFAESVLQRSLLSHAPPTVA